MEDILYFVDAYSDVDDYVEEYELENNSELDFEDKEPENEEY